MKIVAALSWYAESPAWLAGAVASAGRLCSHLVAVDGAYALFPQGRPRSSSAEHDAIREACSGAGMGLTLHVPSDVWWGNEVEKRSFLFSLCMQVCEPDVDWIFVFDGDDIVRKVPGDVCAQLAQTDRAVAEVQMVTMYDPQASGVVTQKASQPRRMLWKALPGLRVERNHWTYVAGDGDGYRCLFGPPGLSRKTHCVSAGSWLSIATINATVNGRNWRAATTRFVTRWRSRRRMTCTCRVLMGARCCCHDDGAAETAGQVASRW